MDFHLDADGRIDYSDTGDRKELGIWLTFDLGRNYFGCLNALASVSDVESGAQSSVHYEGNGYDLRFESEKVTVEHRFLDRAGDYGFQEVKTAIEDFWCFIIRLPENPAVTRVYRPDLAEPLASLVLWESTWQRPHPYRGRLEGIPVEGPA